MGTLLSLAIVFRYSMASSAEFLQHTLRLNPEEVIIRSLMKLSISLSSINRTCLHREGEDDFIESFLKMLVVTGGIEPPTQGFSVPCSPTELCHR